MAKIVVAGCSDCPYYAKVELLADKLKINVPNFQVHKIVKTRKEWNSWISEICKSNNWVIKDSPIIWRELVDRGGKGHLIGGSNEFQEYVRCYYNIISDFTSVQMQDIASDNVRFKDDEDRENREFKALSTPTKVCISGATNEAVPHFVISLARGDVLGPATELSIVFLDKTDNLGLLKSLQMGTFDLAYPLVRSISITDDTEAALSDSSFVIIFDDMSGYIEYQQANWLLNSQDQYEYVGNVIENCCPADVKVLLVPTTARNFVAINVLSMHRMLQRVPKFNVVGLSRPLEQQVRSVVARKLAVNPADVHNIVVWGNIGGKTFIDLRNARVHRYDGAVVGPEPFSVGVERTIWDKKWLKTDLESTVGGRFDEVCALRGNKSGNPLAVAAAVSSFVNQWVNGDERGYIHSLAIASEGWYEVPEGMVFSMPVTMTPKGYWTVVQDIELSEAQFKRINECVEDINQNAKIIYPWMSNNNAAEMAIDEGFIDSQIYALMQEIYPKEELSSIKSLINNSLMLDEKIEISRSKDLLISTVIDLQKPPGIKSTATAENPVKLEGQQSEPEINVLDTVDRPMGETNGETEEEIADPEDAIERIDGENDDQEVDYNSENASVDQSKADLEDD